MNDVIKEDDIKIIIYNQIKALNFLHSAGLMHRDYKPSNVLIDEYSRIMICDYGMARTVPKLNEQEARIKQLRKKEFKAVLNAKDQ